MSLVDNTDAGWKVSIRTMVHRFPVSKQECAELFAGAGAMTAYWRTVFGKVVCIDSDAAKLDTIKQQGWDNVVILCGKNEELLHTTASVEVVDCDAYGLVLPTIKAVLRSSKTKKKLIFFTDGTPKFAHKNRRGDRFKSGLLELNPTGFDYNRNYQGGVYYGWAYWDDCSQIAATLNIMEAMKL